MRLFKSCCDAFVLSVSTILHVFLFWSSGLDPPRAKQFLGQCNDSVSSLTYGAAERRGAEPASAQLNRERFVAFAKGEFELTDLSFLAHVEPLDG